MMKIIPFALALAVVAMSPVNSAFASECDKIHDADDKAHCLEEEAKGNK